MQSYSLILSHSERLRTKIESRTAKVGMIGMGYGPAAGIAFQRTDLSGYRL
jgi:hypothetical protein